jgi:hypothetical protein
LREAKEVQERDGEFQGPDGKYVATFTRVSTGEKKDNDGNEVGWAVIELHVADVEGQEDYSGQKLPIIYFRFTDTASTPQPRKNRSDSSRLCHSLASTPQSLTTNSTMLSTKLAAVW